jgi:hypothetical protein
LLPAKLSQEMTKLDINAEKENTHATEGQNVNEYSEVGYFSHLHSSISP